MAGAKQYNFFEPNDPPKVHPAIRRDERKPLTVGCLRILERLKIGPARNYEMVAVGGIRYGARIKELRDHGYDIDVEFVSPRVYEYSLKEGKRK